MYRSTLLLLLPLLSVVSFLVLSPVTLLSSLVEVRCIVQDSLPVLNLLIPLVEVKSVVQDKLDAQHEVEQWQSQGK